MFSLSSSKTLTRLALATGLLSQLVLGVTIDDVFRVKEGTEKGGCDASKADLALWFEDSIKLADIAAAGIAATDDKTREYLDGFFSIGPGGDTSTVSRTLPQSSNLRKSHSNLIFQFSLAEFRKCSAVSRSHLVVSHGSFATVPGSKVSTLSLCIKLSVLTSRI